jgi:hypothetical protein
MTPPQTPATPPGVPIPYPNTAMASDTSDGSSAVKIGGEEVMLKDKSYFKTSTGDEAGAAPQKNVVTSQTRGKAYFIAWSMDVKVEGENVVRNMDMTTHNHGSLPAGAPPTVHTALAAMGKIPECKEDKEAVEEECDPWEEKATCPEDLEDAIDDAEDTRQAAKDAGGPRSAAYISASAEVRDLYKQYANAMERNACRRALRCVMIPYRDTDKVKCRKQTGDHLIEQATVNDLGNYDINAAPTALVEGPSYHIGTHGLGHEGRTNAARKTRGTFTVEKAAEVGAEQHAETFPNAECNEDCIKKQLLKGHKDMDVKPGDKAKKPRLHSRHNEDFKEEWDEAQDDLADVLG